MAQTIAPSWVFDRFDVEDMIIGNQKKWITTKIDGKSMKSTCNIL